MYTYTSHNTTLPRSQEQHNGLGNALKNIIYILKMAYLDLTIMYDVFKFTASESCKEKCVNHTFNRGPSNTILKHIYITTLHNMTIC